MLTQEQKYVAAVCLARSNMGQSLPEKEKVSDALLYAQGLESSVEWLCQEMIEDDGIQECIVEEARSWLAMIDERGLVDYPTVYLLVS